MGDAPKVINTRFQHTETENQMTNEQLLADAAIALAKGNAANEAGDYEYAAKCFFAYHSLMGMVA